MPKEHTYIAEKALRKKHSLRGAENRQAGSTISIKKHGYIPALREGEEETDPVVTAFEKRQPIAVTLGTAYDEWCLGRIASFLGKKEEAAKYNKLGYNYRTVWNPETKFFHPKDKDGKFIEPFDYRWSGGMGARDYMAKTTVGYIAGMFLTMYLI